MHSDEKAPSHRWQATALTLMAIGLAGCSQPAVRGYQLQVVPEGFLYSANVTQGVNVFPDREILSQGMWLGDIQAFEPQSEIYVTRYVGNATLEQSQASRNVQATRYGNPASIDYGPVVPVTIDGQAAFAWMETRFDENDAVRSMKYTAAIPYDTVTYTVEFSTSVARRLHPDSLTRVVHSWGFGETVVLWGVIAKVGAVLAALVGLLVYKARG